MEQNAKFPFSVIEGGKKERSETTSDLSRETLGYLLAYRDYVIKHMGSNGMLMRYATEIDQLIIFIKIELSKSGTGASKVTAGKYSEKILRNEQIDTAADLLWEKIRHTPSSKALKERLEHFFNIRKKSHDVIREITAANPEK